MNTKKKLILIITLFLMPAFALIACNNNEPTPAQHTASAAELNYEASVVGSSLSAAGVEYAVEKNIYELEEKIDSSVPQTATLTVNGRRLEGTYSHSKKIFPNTFYKHIYYSTDNSFEFCLDDSGQLIFFFSNESEAETTKELTEEACLAIAKDFIRDTVSDQFDLDEYTVNKSDGITLGYTFEFKKYIDGFATMDKARVGVLKNGTVFLYNSTMFGRISVEDMPKLDREKAIQAIEEKLDVIYRNVKADYAAVNYKEPDLHFALLDDGTPAIYCTVSVRFEDGSGGSFGELVSMIIT